jgi:hypothetical protein
MGEPKFRICSGRLAVEPARGQMGRCTVVCMRFFDSWWERLPTVRHLSPVVIVALALMVMRPLGYCWE